MSEIVWTPALRAQVWPSRAHPNPDFLVEIARRSSGSRVFPLDPATWRAKAEANWAENHRNHRVKALHRTGMANNSPHWQRVITVAIARCEQPTVEIPLEVDVEAASVVTHLASLYTSVAYWATRGGLAFAVRALARCAEISTYGKANRYIDERGDWMVEDRTYSFFEPEYLKDEWPILRALLADASESDYAEARTAAEEILDRTATGTCLERAMQLWIPFAFPDEPAFAERGRATALEAAELISKPKKPSDFTISIAIARYLSVASIDTGLAVLAHRHGAIGLEDLLTILSHRGLAPMLQLLEPAMEKWISERHRKGWCKLLFPLRSNEIVELIAKRYPDSKAVIDAVAKYNKPPKAKKKKP